MSPPSLQMNGSTFHPPAPLVGVGVRARGLECGASAISWSRIVGGTFTRPSSARPGCTSDSRIGVERKAVVVVLPFVGRQADLGRCCAASSLKPRADLSSGTRTPKFASSGTQMMSARTRSGSWSPATAVIKLLVQVVIRDGNVFDRHLGVKFLERRNDGLLESLHFGRIRTVVRARTSPSRRSRRSCPSEPALEQAASTMSAVAVASAPPILAAFTSSTLSIELRCSHAEAWLSALRGPKHCVGDARGRGSP